MWDAIGSNNCTVPSPHCCRNLLSHLVKVSGESFGSTSHPWNQGCFFFKLKGGKCAPMPSKCVPDVAPLSTKVPGESVGWNSPWNGICDAFGSDKAISARFSLHLRTKAFPMVGVPANFF